MVDQLDIFSSSLSTRFPPVRPFLPFISALTGFHDWGLVARWDQLLITSNYYLPSTPKDQSMNHQDNWSTRQSTWWFFYLTKILIFRLNQKNLITAPNAPNTYLFCPSPKTYSYRRWNFCCNKEHQQGMRTQVQVQPLDWLTYSPLRHQPQPCKRGRFLYKGWLAVSLLGFL